MDPNDLARSIADAYARRVSIPAPSSLNPAFCLSDAYATEAALVRLRRAGGHKTAGLKVGFANKALWRVTKLDTLVWAHMYDDTVHYAKDGTAALATGSMFSPKIEPELVFKMARSLEGRSRGGALPPSEILESVEWIAIGFEIIDCVFPDWKFRPSDFVAAYGLHAGLVVGDPAPVDSATISDLVEKLPNFEVRLFRHAEQVAAGSGKNSLRSPALCLAELDAAITRRSDAEPLAASDLVSSGTLTDSQPIAAGEVWRVEADGLDVRPLTLTLG